MLQRIQQNVGGDICGGTGRSNCFVYMWTMYKNVISLCRTLAKRKDAAALKAHAGGNTGSSLSLSTPCPICINSYVTMASVYNRLSSAEAVGAQKQEMTSAKRPSLWLWGFSSGWKQHRDGVTLKFKTNQTAKHNCGGNLPGCKGHQQNTLQIFCCHVIVLQPLYLFGYFSISWISS